MERWRPFVAEIAPLFADFELVNLTSGMIVTVETKRGRRTYGHQLCALQPSAETQA
jgi:hypothetical protein